MIKLFHSGLQFDVEHPGGRPPALAAVHRVRKIGFGRFGRDAVSKVAGLLCFIVFIIIIITTTLFDFFHLWKIIFSRVPFKRNVNVTMCQKKSKKKLRIIINN